MNKCISLKRIFFVSALFLVGCGEFAMNGSFSSSARPEAPKEPEKLEVISPTSAQKILGGFTVKGKCDPGATIRVSGLDLVSTQSSTCSTEGIFSVPVQLQNAILTKGFTVNQTTTGNATSNVTIASLEVEADGIVFLGDSITLAAGPFGYRDYVSILTLGRYSMGPNSNAGVGGERTDQIDTRTASVITANPRAKVYVVMAGTNDINQANRTDDQIKTSLTSIYTKLRAAGIRIVAATIPRGAPFNGTQNTQRTAINDWIKSQASDDFFVADIEAAYNPGTQSDDGIHPNPSGAYGIAKVLANLLNPLAVADHFFSSGTPAGNLNPVYDMSGTAGGKWQSSGVVATGYTVSSSDAGLTVVNSKTTLNGADAQVINITGTASGSASVIINDGGQTVTGVTGDNFEAYASFEAAPNPTGINGFGLFFNGDNILHNAMGSNADPHWGADTFRGVLRTKPTTLTSGFSTSKYADLRIGIRAGVAVNFSITISKFGYRKIP